MAVIAYVLVAVSLLIGICSLLQTRTMGKKLVDNDNTIKNLQALTNQWMMRYEKERASHQKSIEALTNQINNMDTRMKNLEYIVSKMDGRVIERDEKSKIVSIKRVI